MEQEMFFTSDLRNVSIEFSKDRIAMIEDKNRGKELLIIAFMRYSVSGVGRIVTTLEKISAGCGHQKTRNTRFYTFIRETLQRYAENGWIIIDNDIMKVSITKCIEIEVDKKKELFMCKKNFVTLNMAEFTMLTNSKSTSKKDTLLLTYLALKQHVYTESKTTLIYPNKSMIQSITGISINTLNKAYNDLVMIGLLYKSTEMFYKNKAGDICRARDVFALEKKDISKSKEILESIYHTSVFAKKAPIID